ncbi:MAG: HvfA family oxazolone/thioamide-modified RiPP metallophore [Burkholderiales bacterium]
MNKTALTLALGSAFAASLAMAPVAKAAGNPFAMDTLNSGYQVAGDDKKADGKCGEGKCGASKTGETKAGSDVGKNVSEKKADGKCGEGKCGASKTGEKKADNK